VERNQANLLQGTLDLLILKAIGGGEFHAWALLGVSSR
jgi:PadR family transcriptional regulator PadR